MIAQMDRIEIVTLRERLGDLIAYLQDQGIMHMEDVPLAVETAPRYLHRIHLTDAQKAEMEGLEQLDTMLREIIPLLSIRVKREDAMAATAPLQSVDVIEWRKRARVWSRELRSLVRRRANIQDNLDVMKNYLRTLRQIEALLPHRDAVLGRDARAVVLHGESDAGERDLEQHLREHIGEEVALSSQRLGRHSRLVVILYPETENHAVQHALNEEGIASVDLPDREVEGVPFDQALANMEATLRGYYQNLAELREQLDTFSRTHGPDIAAMTSTVADRLARLRVLKHFAQSEMVAVVRGWVPRKVSEPFIKAIEDRFGADVAVERLPVTRVERSRIPILLQNPQSLRHFEVLLAMMKPPSYGSMDPSILVGLFFVLFYGFILGDAVYGLVVIGLAWWFRRAYGHRGEAIRAASTVGMCAGVSAFIFGVLYGEYAGDLGEQFLGIHPIWFHRAHDVVTLLVVAIAIGAVHIVLSLLLSVWANFRAGHAKHALEKLGLLMGLLAVGMVTLAATGVIPVAVEILLLLVALFLVASIALLIKAVGAMAPIQFLEIISLTSNVLSYSRLMALGMASVALADVANHLAELIGNPWIGVPVAILIHVVNVCIGMFSPTLHSLRLNYVEFLP